MGIVFEASDGPLDRRVAVKHEIVALRGVAALSTEKRQGWRTARGGLSKARENESNGQQAEGFSFRQEYLNRCCEVLGDEHPCTSASYNRLAFNLVNQGNNGEAQPLIHNVLDIRRKGTR
jgi:hypothetical protein